MALVPYSLADALRFLRKGNGKDKNFALRKKLKNRAKNRLARKSRRLNLRRGKVAGRQ